MSPKVVSAIQIRVGLTFIRMCVGNQILCDHENGDLSIGRFHSLVNLDFAFHLLFINEFLVSIFIYEYY